MFDYTLEVVKYEKYVKYQIFAVHLNIDTRRRLLCHIRDYDFEMFSTQEHWNSWVEMEKSGGNAWFIKSDPSGWKFIRDCFSKIVVFNVMNK
jgi:hypothetical protein